jgi:hypothetical protein
MDMPPPMTNKNYNRTVKTLVTKIKSVAEETMTDAADEIRGTSDLTDTSISCDGSWQRRGYSSLSGVVTVISMINGKVLDAEPLCKFCKACNSMEHLRKTNPEAYDQWKLKHACTLNYSGSSSGMEVVGAKAMLGRSIATRQLRYTCYYGDGDSKAFKSIEDIYGDDKVIKMECVGHVQKRVGTRLRKLKKDKTGLGGKGRLTNFTVDRLQNYYGIAIRSNVNDLEGMKKAILASLFHVASSKEKDYHSHCPDGASSWCRFKADKETNPEKPTYKPGAGLPLEIISEEEMSPWEDPKSEREFQFLDMGAVTEDEVFYHVAITIWCI